MTKTCLLLLGVMTIPLSVLYAQPTPNSTVTRTTYTTTADIPHVPTYPMVEIEGRYWFPELDGNVFVTEGNQSTNVDFKSDLGLDDDNGIPGGKLKIHLMPEVSLRASYLYLHYDGSNTLSRTIVYDGQTYPVSTYVESKLRVHYFSLGGQWNFIHTDHFKAAFILEAKGISARSSLEAPGLGFSNKQNFTGGAPTPGIGLKYNIIDNVGVFAEVTGLPAGGYGHFLDAEAGLKWDIIPNLALSGGYRYIDIEVDYKDDSGELNLQGPFAALTLKF